MERAQCGHSPGQWTTRRFADRITTECCSLRHFLNSPRRDHLQVFVLPLHVLEQQSGLWLHGEPEGWHVVGIVVVVLEVVVPVGCVLDVVVVIARVVDVVVL